MAHGAATVNRQLRGPWLVLAVGVAAAALTVVAGNVRLGGYLLALAFALTAALRLALPARVVGAVAVRSRSTDVIGLAKFALWEGTASIYLQHAFLPPVPFFVR